MLLAGILPMPPVFAMPGWLCLSPFQRSMLQIGSRFRGDRRHGFEAGLSITLRQVFLRTKQAFAVGSQDRDQAPGRVESS